MILGEADGDLYKWYGKMRPYFISERISYFRIINK
jgi:hypothetical protein